MYQKLSVVVVLLFATVFNCYGISKSDSIDVLLAKEKSPQIRIALLNSNARAVLRSNPSQALVYNAQALAYFGNEQKEMADSLYLENLFTLGLYYSRIQLNDSVIYIQGMVFNLAKDEYEIIAARAVNERAISFESLGNYTQALNDYFTALKLYEKVDDDRGVMHELMNIGLIYQYQKKYNQAISLYNRAIKIGEKIRDEEGSVGVYNNLAIVYLEQKKFALSLTCFEKVLAFDLSSGDSANIADSYNNIGAANQGLNRYNEALKYYDASLKIKHSLDDYEGYANTCNNVASVYLDKKSSETLTWLKKAEEIGVKYKLNAIMLENYRIARLHYTNENDHKKALEYADLYYALQDSMKLGELVLQTENVQKQYELEKRAKELVIKDAEIAESRYKEWIYLLILCVILIAAAYLYYTMHKAKAMNVQLKLHKEEIVKMNDDLIKKNSEAESARHEAEQAVKAKSQFLSVMSHEIKTPLNAIIGISNLLGENEPREDQKENILVLQRSSDNLLTLLNDILDYNEIESGKVKAELVDFSLKQQMNQLFNLFRAKTQQKAIDLLFEYDDRIPERLTGDSFHLNQILLNLMSNAVKFTNKGFVKIAVKLYAHHENTYTIGFSISDTGIGIPLHKLNSIFDPFTQADSQTTRKFGGTGLGLSISKKLLGFFDAQMQVKSQVDTGSEFSFIIKFNEGRNKAETNSVQVSVDSEPVNDLTGRRILVVEDNTVNVFVIRQFLARWNAEITIADNGEKAIEKYIQQKHDVVLMDLHMPVMDGFEATRQILSIDPSARIIAITATHEEEIKEQIKSAGMLDIILKPFQPDDLVKKIRNVIA